MNEIYRVFTNADRVLVDKRLYECYPVPGFNNELAAIMNSTFFSFMVELGARTGLGQGLVDMTVYELQQIKIPDPGLIEGVRNLSREIGPLADELHSEDRLDLDKSVFDAIGLSQAQREAVYREYQILVERRLGRAITITT